jgi:hypothetical protein
VLDTDTVFHGVDTVGGADEPAPPVEVGSTLTHVGGDEWVLAGAQGNEVRRYRWPELRLSVSWKAYCFADEAERDAWAAHSDDLSLEAILSTLLDDLAIERPASDAELGKVLIDRYITFPS